MYISYVGKKFGQSSKKKLVSLMIIHYKSGVNHGGYGKLKEEFIWIDRRKDL